MHSTNDIRAAFLAFFKRHGHTVLPSSSLVPHNDPTLMFANAGMNQFKNIFTGVEKAPSPRATTSQKCVRAGGKHNDLDNVGYTARHHTFFEMLGNFSFGDYFKETAIELAWELLTKDFAIAPERLCVTVYHDDDVAWNHWKKLTGFADHKIIRISTNDNFWAMGDTGPCGPCSEIFYDHGENIKGGPPGSPDADGDRFTEIWNLVFMQYEQVDAATRIALPKPSIDTGAGLERIAAVLQGVHDNYEIDLFAHLIKNTEITARRLSGKYYTPNPVAYRVIADHLRASCFLIADGVDPSNEGRGYVLRRIMRRAMRYAHQLGCNAPLMYHLVPTLVHEMGNAYPELTRANWAIIESLRTEEDRFKQMLDRGLKLLKEESSNIPRGGMLPGAVAFKLYDTYGFPLDLTQDILRARGVSVDTPGFETSMEGQRSMAREAWKGSGEKAVGKLWFEIKERVGATKFLGYEEDEAESRILAIVKDGEAVQGASAGDEVSIVFDQTPFYGESGGQIGDTGVLSSGNATIAEVLDTQKPLDDFQVHRVKLKVSLDVGERVHASIDTARRNKIRANHSATHLLHKALRDLLGDHVTQKGSLVAPDRLRFDFSHPKTVSREEIATIEQKVNEVIAQRASVACKVMAPEEAIQAGAMALFGEKYGDRVRVLSMGIGDSGLGIREVKSLNPQSPTPNPYSVELCGGTHVKNTGDIGLFAVTGEGSVASGIRRIEAVTGEGARAYYIAELQKQDEQLQKLGRPVAGVAVLDKAPLKDLPALFKAESERRAAGIAAAMEENKKLAKAEAEAKKQAALQHAGDVQPEMVNGVNFIGKIFDGLDPKELRALAEQYRKQADVVALGTSVEGKVSVLVASAKGNAPALVQAAVAALGGKGGGGRPEMAQGGGPEATKLPEALEIVKKLL